MGQTLAGDFKGFLTQGQMNLCRMLLPQCICPRFLPQLSAKYLLMLVLIMGGMPFQPQQRGSSGQTLEMMGVAAAVTWRLKPWCYFQECCDEPWINTTNITSGLEEVLQGRLFGQHIVSETVVAALMGHLSSPDPPKPLVLSFHGRTGTGKNFVSRLIAESIYTKGMDSQYVHLKIADRDFRHISKFEEYKESLHIEVFESAKACGRQLYIFDEVENMPPGILDSIRPFLEYRDNVEGVRFNKAIFLFLSNTASREISDYTLKHLQAGQIREDITLHDVEHLIESSAFSMAGSGFQSARLIDKYLISHYVPFLPLETKHVRNCILAELDRDKLPPNADIENLVEGVVKELQFWPKGLEIFSTKGCKSVVEKLNLALFRLNRRRTLLNHKHGNNQKNKKTDL